MAITRAISTVLIGVAIIAATHVAEGEVSTEIQKDVSEILMSPTTLETLYTDGKGQSTPSILSFMQ